MILAAFSPVGLADLDGALALQVRTDRKYVVALATLDAALARLSETHGALDIDGRRAFAYDTVYFDTPELLTARTHAQGRRRRFKCRSRLYVESGTCAFELKTKGRREETLKLRMPYLPVHHGEITGDARAFLHEHLETVPDLLAVLRTTYTRTTLAGPGERVTVDRDLSFGSAVLRPGWAIVETKSAAATGVADRVLATLGARPTALSKYVVGAGLTLMTAPPNDARRVIRRYFEHA